jgi:hypothetical protein
MSRVDHKLRHFHFAEVLRDSPETSHKLAFCMEKLRRVETWACREGRGVTDISAHKFPW